MPGLSIHVVDVSRGVVATGMGVNVHRINPDGSRVLIAAGTLSSTGVLADPALAEHLEPGAYEASFAVADYYRAAGVAIPAVPFLDVVDYRFGIADSRAHYHLPFKCTPWGYSCFRGGA
jgi:5-hydroxyisourate hydrolase